MPHRSGRLRNFKFYYTEKVIPECNHQYSQTPSYTRIIQLLLRNLWSLSQYLANHHVQVSRINFVSMTSSRLDTILVSILTRSSSAWLRGGQTSVRQFFELKSYLILNDGSNLLGVRFTPGGVDHHGTVLLIEKGFFGDRGYLSNKIFKLLWIQGVELIIRLCKNMKLQLLDLVDKILLRKRTLVEMVNDQLTNICQIERSRHPSPINAFVPLLVRFTACTWQEKWPTPSWAAKD